MNEIIEPQEFGIHSTWRLIHRAVEDGIQRITRCMPVRGRGVLLQTQTREVVVDADGNNQGFVPGALVLSEPYEIRDVVLVEWAETKESPIEISPGVPASRRIEIGHRELMSVKEAEAQFKDPKKPKEKVTAGTVFTLDVTRAKNNAAKAA